MCRLYKSPRTLVFDSEVCKLRYVNFSSNDVSVEEYFLGFLNVKGLFDITYNELKSLGLDIDNMRGEGMPMDQT